MQQNEQQPPATGFVNPSPSAVTNLLFNKDYLNNHYVIKGSFLLPLQLIEFKNFVEAGFSNEIIQYLGEGSH